METISKCVEVANIHIEEVIVANLTVGDGTEEDPVRGVTQYWDKKGNLIAIKDPWDSEKLKMKKV